MHAYSNNRYDDIYTYIFLRRHLPTGLKRFPLHAQVCTTYGRFNCKHTHTHTEQPYTQRKTERHKRRDNIIYVGSEHSMAKATTQFERILQVQAKDILQFLFADERRTEMILYGKGKMYLDFEDEPVPSQRQQIRYWETLLIPNN